MAEVLQSMMSGDERSSIRITGAEQQRVMGAQGEEQGEKERSYL